MSTWRTFINTSRACIKSPETERHNYFESILYLFPCNVSASRADSSREDARRLQEELFSNYTNILRPVGNYEEPVVVESDLVLKQLVEVDVKTQQMTLLIWHRLVWFDRFLKWKMEDYGGIRSLRF